MATLGVIQRYGRVGLSLLWISAWLATSAVTARPTGAQAGNDAWTTPVNLSRSGAATNPRMALDDQGMLHVVWEDAFAGLMYTNFDGEQWSAAGAVAFPFLAADLQLISDGRGRIHAFWAGEDSSLLYSSAPANRLADPAAWTEPQTIALSALAAEVRVESSGRLHVAFVRTAETTELSAGIYYRRMTSAGSGWHAEVSLFQSRYFLGMVKEDISLDLALAEAGESMAVYVTWDHRPRKEVLLAASEDSGLNWGEATVVDRPRSDHGYALPFNPVIEATAEQVVLVWQVGEPGYGCRQYTRWLTGANESWSDSQLMFDESLACPRQNRFLRAGGDLRFLLSDFAAGSYVSAWNGARWSKPQSLEDLHRFEDPETAAQVKLACQQAALAPEDRLIMLGCDPASEDVWIASRLLGRTESWFEKSVWSNPLTVATLEGRMSSPLVLTDSQNRAHAMWMQDDSNGAGQLSVFHAQSDGDRWSRPGAILALPRDDVGHFSATLSDDERLLVALNGRNSGQTYFTWAGSAQAFSSADWTPPQQLPVPAAVGAFPDIQLSAGGKIAIAYAVPINEERGVYMTEAAGRDAAWSPPRRIFDGVAAAWPVVGAPQLIYGSDGSAHALFGTFAPPGSNQSLGLFYARSQDGGASWTEPETVTQNPARWVQLLGADSALVHRLWQEANGNGWRLLHAWSADAGRNWSHAEVIPDVPATTEQVAATLDPAGHIHVILIARDTQSQLTLHHTVWDADRWQSAGSISLGAGAGKTVTAVTATASRSGQLDVMYILSQLDSQAVTAVDQLVYTRRDLSLVETAASGLPSPTPMPSPTLSEPVFLQPEPLATPTMDVSVLAQGGRPVSTNGPTDNAVTVVGMGAALATVLVAVVFGAQRIMKRR